MSKYKTEDKNTIRAFGGNRIIQENDSNEEKQKQEAENKKKAKLKAEEIEKKKLTLWVKQHVNY